MAGLTDKPAIIEMTDTERIDILEKALRNGDISIFSSSHRETLSIIYRVEGVEGIYRCQALGVNLRDAIDDMKGK